MTNSLYVGNLPHACGDEDLRTALEAQGVTTTKVTVVNDLRTGKSRGFAFVELESEEATTAALETLRGMEVDGRELKIGNAKPRRSAGPSKSSGGFGDRPRRGGWGGPR